MPGPGGVGKSTVFTAVTAFCRSWQRPGSFIITATTGKAAVNVRGTTIQSFILRCATKSVKEHLHAFKVLAIDEFTTSSQQLTPNLSPLVPPTTNCIPPSTKNNIQLLPHANQITPLLLPHCLSPLPHEMTLLAETYFSESMPQDRILIDKFNHKITGRTLATLRDGKWLNDEVINFYMLLLQHRDDSILNTMLPQYRPSRFFPSFFITKLLTKRLDKYDYRQVKRWTRSIDVFDFEKLYFPINVSNSHWTLAVVYMQTRRIQYYDSLLNTTTIYLTALKRWIQDEHADKKGIPLLNNDEWEVVPCSSETTPKQTNGYDCGVFTIMSADLISRNLDIMLLSQNYMIVRGHLGSS